VYTLARLQSTAARAQSCESGILFAPDIHEGIIISSILVGFTDAQQEGGVVDQDSTIVLQRSSIWKYALWARDVVTSTSVGGGHGSSFGCMVSWTRWFREMASPPWVRDIHRTRSLLDWHTWR